jgi:hypothetical protein
MAADYMAYRPPQPVDIDPDSKMEAGYVNFIVGAELAMEQ